MCHCDRVTLDYAQVSNTNKWRGKSNGNWLTQVFL